VESDTAQRIRERLQTEEAHASEGFAEGNRRKDRLMVAANGARMMAFGDALKKTSTKRLPRRLSGQFSKPAALRIGPLPGESFAFWTGC
jgi:sarcosine oxidase gamma subunit